MVLWGQSFDRTGERVWHTTIPLALIAGSIVLGSAQRTLSSSDVSQFESDHPGKLNSTPVMLRIWQNLAAAAYSSPRSSNANSLCGAFSADSPKIERPRGPDFAPDGFRSSSPTSPASQSVSVGGNAAHSGARWQLASLHSKPKVPRPLSDRCSCRYCSPIADHGSFILSGRPVRRKLSIS